jgi:hypothetical protein
VITRASLARGYSWLLLIGIKLTKEIKNLYLATEASQRGKVNDFIVTLGLNNNAFILDKVKVG